MEIFIIEKKRLRNKTIEETDREKSIINQERDNKLLYDEESKAISQESVSSKKIIYTHDISAQIMELFENLLDQYDVTIPSPEDEEKEPENNARLYGSVYSDLLDKVEDVIKEKLNENNISYIADEFSGTW